ncbi:phage/plasmid primase, P4 family [candidate division KSB1 bacterium]
MKGSIESMTPKKKDRLSIFRSTSGIEFSSEEVLKALQDNEDGDAALFIKRFRGVFCFDHSAKRWFKWDGHFWVEDKLDQVTGAVSEIIEIYASEAIRQGNLNIESRKIQHNETVTQHKNNQDILLKRINSLHSAYRKKNIVNLAKTGAGTLAITGDDWDIQTMILCCPNGVIDLKTGKRRNGNPKEYIKTIINTEFRGLKCPAPRWEKYLKEIFDNDYELINYVQRLVGYAVTGLNIEGVFPIFYGKGRNGKSTFFNIIKHVLGDISGPVEAEILLNHRFNRTSGAPRSDIMALRRKRIVWASEVKEGQGFDQAQIKNITGGDTLTGREVYGKHQIEFKPTHTVFLQTNYKPQATSEDYAFWQRLKLIPFNAHFVDNPEAIDEMEKDSNLLKKLKSESHGILAWIIKGCIDYLKNGLGTPESVKSATNDYCKNEDPLGQFIDDRCELNEDAKIQSGILYKAYLTWCDGNEWEPVNLTKFGKKIKRRFNYTKTNIVTYHGIKLCKNNGEL